MQDTRRKRLEAVIQEEMSVVVPRELKDPRIPIVTFTAVHLTEDAGLATVLVSVLGGAPGEDGDRKMRQCLEGLNSARGFLRRHLAKVLTIRHVPEIVFKEDRGFENSLRVNELLKQIGSETKPDAGTEPKPDGDDAGTD